MRELESVEYPNRLLSLEEGEDERVDGEVQIVSVKMADPIGFDDDETSSIAVLSSGLTTIAVPVKQTENGIQILPLAPIVPRTVSELPGRRTGAGPVALR